MENIQERIATIMSIKNLSNAEFANAIGVQPSNISHILSGRNKPSLDLIMKIINRYPEIRLDWMLLGEGSMNREYQPDLFSANNLIMENRKEKIPGESKIQGATTGSDDLAKGNEGKNNDLEFESAEDKRIKPETNKMNEAVEKVVHDSEKSTATGDVEKIITI